MWTLEEYAELFRVEQHLKKKIMDNDTMMKCIIIVTRMIKEVLQLLQQMFNKLKRKMQQLPFTMSSTRWGKKKKTVHFRRISAIKLICASKNNSFSAVNCT